MKRIDRYVLSAFLRNYLISVAVLVGLFIVMDSVFNFDEFSDGGADATVWATLSAIVSYYFYQSFFVYAQLAGVIPVLAAAFTFMRMSRFNELTALLAAGVPMLRVAMPVILAAVAINLLVQPLLNEALLPALVPKITRDRSQAAASAAQRAERGFDVQAMPDGRGGIFDAARFHGARPGRPAWVESMTVVERDPVGAISAMTAAERGDWDAAAGAWRLQDGRRVTQLAAAPPPPGEPDLPDQPGAAASLLTGAAAALRQSPAEPVDALASDVTPAEIELFHSANAGAGLGGSYFDLLSTRQLDALLARPRVYAAADLLRAKHTRLASLVMNVVLMLLAIPCVLTRQPGQLKRAAAKTLLLVGAAMGTIFLCQLLAKDPPSPALAGKWPAWMAWAPVLVYGPISVLLLDRIES